MKLLGLLLGLLYHLYTCMMQWHRAVNFMMFECLLSCSYMNVLIKNSSKLFFTHELLILIKLLNNFYDFIQIKLLENACVSQEKFKSEESVAQKLPSIKWEDFF